MSDKRVRYLSLVGGKHGGCHELTRKTTRTRRAVLAVIGTGTIGSVANAQENRGGGPTNSVRIHFEDCTSCRVTGAASLEGLNYQARISYWIPDDASYHWWADGPIGQLPMDYDLWDDLEPFLLSRGDDPAAVERERIVQFLVYDGEDWAESVIANEENDTFDSQAEC